MTRLTLSHVLAARRAIQQYVWPTPLAPSEALSSYTGAQVYLKLECWQRTGSFKVRGAVNKVLSLCPEVWMQGLVTASAGNHGLGVAYACDSQFPVDLTVFVPESASVAKVKRLAKYRCQVRRAGADYDQAHALAEAYSRETGKTYISAYDDVYVIAGQGTVGLEVMEELPGVDVLLVPVGGGGLIAGLATVAKAVHPAVQIIGLQPEASPAARDSLRDGRPYETYPAEPTICDGLAGGFGRLPFELARDLIDEVLIVPEAAIRYAVAWLLQSEQLLVEGSGAIAIAPLLNGQLHLGGKKVVAVLTGRNLTSDLLAQILEEGRNDPSDSL
jgi:threonine dehydratase